MIAHQAMEVDLPFDWEALEPSFFKGQEPGMGVMTRLLVGAVACAAT